ncbi:MAG: NapC/NirT family cytochrome c [Candidatus Omnitrophota bacterium]|nr:NapC/NirT family cytochrome c [Candidatus Omnitrophota bacterium]
MTKKKALIIIAAVLLLFIAGFVFLFEFSTSPQFCKSCHIMKPYYESWKASKHNKVGCVECHYPPSGPREYLWKKFQALSEVVKYVTRTYKPRPFAEVEDSACLREGCHSKRLLDGKLTFGRGVKFDHRPHLTESRRGRQLRCTSCHSQIMVGSHVEVTLDTCYLCHFKGLKGARELKPIGGCVSCHEVPEKEFTLGNMKYNHKDFAAKHGVECQDCHLNVIQGSGAAPKDRCYSCHNQPERLDRYGDIAFIHENHITRHSVACFHCHTEMTHSVKTVSQQPKLDCAMCHSDTHSGQKAMYEGKGGRGVPEMPGPMHLAQVGCLACHNVEDEDKEGRGAEQLFNGKTFKASDAACIKCHGEKYAGLIDDWKKELDNALKAIDPRLKEAQNVLSQASADAPNISRLKDLYGGAIYNYDFVRSSTGIHNIYYSARLLENVNDGLEKFRKESGRELPALQKASLLDGSYCLTLCHARLDVKIPEEVKYKGKPMPHSMHVDEAGTCGACHEIGRHKEIPLKSDLSICGTCHEDGM